MVKFIPVLLLFFGCSNILTSDEKPKRELVLELYMNLPYTDDGYYLFNYPNGSPHTYTAVESISTPLFMGPGCKIRQFLLGLHPPFFKPNIFEYSSREGKWV